MADAPKTNALQKPLTPSAELEAVIGKGQVSRSDAVKKVWDHIKTNNLQDPKDKRQIIADAKLGPLFGGEKSVSMFQMNSHLAKHLK